MKTEVYTENKKALGWADLFQVSAEDMETFRREEEESEAFLAVCW